MLRREKSCRRVQSGPNRQAYRGNSQGGVYRNKCSTGRRRGERREINGKESQERGGGSREDGAIGRPRSEKKYGDQRELGGGGKTPGALAADDGERFALTGQGELTEENLPGFQRIEENLTSSLRFFTLGGIRGGSIREKEISVLPSLDTGGDLKGRPGLQCWQTWENRELWGGKRYPFRQPIPFKTSRRGILVEGSCPKKRGGE